jgi:alpha-beta hydrolase superfamily lysophospholipase
VIYALLKKPFFGKYQKPWRWPEASPRGEWRKLTFASESGGRLAGLFGAARGQPRGAVVCAHPMGVEAKGFFLKRGHAAFLRDAGFHVLAFDFNGFGESTTGDFAYPLDVIAAGRKLKELAPGLPIGLLAASFGSAWGVCALAQPGHPFESAVLECPFTTLDEYWARYRVPSFTLKMLSVVLPEEAHKLRPIAQAARLQPLRELLFIYGDADTVTPPAMGEQFVEAC